MNEDNAYIVCMRVADTPIARFDDDVVTACFKCGEPIRERPYNPKEPKRICNVCLGDEIHGHDAVEFIIPNSKEQAKELRDLGYDIETN